MAGPDEARQFQPGTSAWRPQHDNLGPGVGDADDGVQEFALDKCPALGLEAEGNEKRRHRAKVRDGDADMVEPS
jgi:hypothetical protein